MFSKRLEKPLLAWQWRQNVIDVDTYGMPWKHWRHILACVDRPLTVFLTLHTVAMSEIDKETMEHLGLSHWKIPSGFNPFISGIAINQHLSDDTRNCGTQSYATNIGGAMGCSESLTRKLRARHWLTHCIGGRNDL